MQELRGLFQFLPDDKQGREVPEMRENDGNAIARGLGMGQRGKMLLRLVPGMLGVDVAA